MHNRGDVLPIWQLCSINCAKLLIDLIVYIAFLLGVRYVRRSLGLPGEAIRHSVLLSWDVFYIEIKKANPGQPTNNKGARHVSS